MLMHQHGFTNEKEFDEMLGKKLKKVTIFGSSEKKEDDFEI
jgi:hypothetical protein